MSFHLKLKISNGIKTITHSFNKDDVSVEELTDAIKKLKQNFSETDKLTLSSGY